MILRTMLVGMLFLAAAAMAQEAVTPEPPLDVNAARAELGKRLFFDYRLSGNTSLACADCHQPERAFTDGEAISAVYTGASHFRNTPTLANVGFRDAWMHDGRFGARPNDVAREMITETYLMNMDMRIMQERLKQDPVYVRMFADARMGETSNGGARNALMDFMKTIQSRNAPYDTGKMLAAAQRGQAIFEARASAPPATQAHSSPTTDPTSSVCRKTRTSGPIRNATRPS